MTIETLPPADPAPEPSGPATPRPLPSPDQLPLAAQTALVDLLAAARSPFAPSIAQLATEHLTFFIELRAMGAHWSQIADLIYERGLVGPTGMVSSAVWRATVSRAFRSQKIPPAGNAVDATPAEVTDSGEADCSARARSIAQQSVTERDDSPRAASDQDGSERRAMRRNARRKMITKQNEPARSVPQQSETQRNESRESATKRNAREPPATAPTRMLSDLRPDSELARIAALIDKPFRTR